MAPVETDLHPSTEDSLHTIFFFLFNHLPPDITSGQGLKKHFIIFSFTIQLNNKIWLAEYSEKAHLSSYPYTERQSAFRRHTSCPSGRRSRCRSTSWTLSETQQRKDKKNTLLQAVEGSGAPVYYMKGALEGVLVKCDSYLQHGSVRPLANTAVPATVVRHAAELGKRRGCCNIAIRTLSYQHVN
jgi:hypothetical protein